MKKLKKICLRSVSEFLTEPEMKRVTGGYDGSTCCIYDLAGCMGCTNDRSLAGAFGGWYACNTSYAWAVCGYQC